MSARRNLLLRTLLVLLGAAAGLAGGELAVRFAAPRRPVSELRGLHEFRPDRPWLYGLRPGARGRLSETGAALYRINADGQRGPRRTRPKPPGVVRVVVLGDSIAFGYGVQEDETFPRVLESLLAERAAGAQVEVVNLGVGGYNAWNEAGLLRDVGLSYEPDLVLVQFCINDLNDPTVHFDAQTRLALSSVPDAAFPDPSLRTSRASAFSRALGWCHRAKLCAAAHDLWLAWTAPEFSVEQYQAAGRSVEDKDRPEWRWLEARYEEMAESSASAGARFAVLAFPYPAQLAGEDPDPVQQQLAALGRRHGWSVVDPLPAFRRASARGERLFLDWWHPTPAGQRLAAKAALQTLACSGELGPAALPACPAGGGSRAR